MTIESHVCHLQLSKRLKELGVKQRSLYFHITFRNESSPPEHWNNVYNQIIRIGQKTSYRERDYLKDMQFYSAFLASELGELLKSHFPIGKKLVFLNFTIDKCPYYESIDKSIEICSPEFKDGDTEANYRALMLIHLIEQGIVKI